MKLHKRMGEVSTQLFSFNLASLFQVSRPSKFYLLLHGIRLCKKKTPCSYAMLKLTLPPRDMLFIQYCTIISPTPDIAYQQTSRLLFSSHQFFNSSGSSSAASRRHLPHIHHPPKLPFAQSLLCPT